VDAFQFQSILMLCVGIGFMIWGIVLALRYYRLKREDRRATAQVKHFRPGYRGGATITVTWTDDNNEQREHDIRLSIWQSVDNEVDIYYDDYHAMLAESKMF